MAKSVDLSSVKEKLKGNGPILVVFGPRANVDTVAAALSLYLSFKSQGKDVLVASPAELRTEFSRLVGLNQVKESIGNRNLVISFGPYQFQDIERISHNEGQGDSFELILQPKGGKKAPDPKEIEFSFRGAAADLIVTVDVAALEELGDMYESERKVFSDATIVSFNRRQEPNYQAVTISDENASSLSELVNDFLMQVNMKPQDDVASNLLAGIDFATNRFQNPLTSPDAFLTAGRLLQNGARRQPMPISPSAIASNPNANFLPFRPGNPLAASSDATQQSSNNNGANGQPPKDWLEPKIFKGGSPSKV